MKSDLIRIDELSELLPDKPSKPTIYNWIRIKSIPHYKYGRTLYFSKSEILTWNDNGRDITKVTR